VGERDNDRIEGNSVDNWINRGLGRDLLLRGSGSDILGQNLGKMC
jgi:Ca2+-binding RTX toxin-like protein